MKGVCEYDSKRWHEIVGVLYYKRVIIWFPVPRRT